jgi:hypothetical protein
MLDWNVVVSVHEDGYKDAVHLLRQFGRVQATDYYNVLVMKVPEPSVFLDRLAVLVDESPGIMNDISRAVPSEESFDFDQRGELRLRQRPGVRIKGPRRGYVLGAGTGPKVFSRPHAQTRLQGASLEPRRRALP